MNIRLNNFICNGMIYGVLFFVFSFLFGYFSFSLPIGKTILVSLPMGVGAFIANGFIQSRFTKSYNKLQSISIILGHSELVILEAPANHYINDHLVSGKLILTNNRLVFRSFYQDEYGWQVNNFDKFEFHPSIFNLGGEFIIYDKVQGKLVFEVDELKIWENALLKM